MEQQEEEAMLVRVSSWNNFFWVSPVEVSTCVKTVLMVTSWSPMCLSVIHQIDTLTNGGSNLPFSESIGIGKSDFTRSGDPD
jgi:hypothetical protein